MTSQKAVAFLLLFIGVLAAFNVSDYLMPQEQNATISYTNFTLNGSAYSIIAVNGADTFLLQNGTPVTDPISINSTVYSYYVQTYYPSQSQINNLLSIIQQFNTSRNSGYNFPGKGEYVCRNQVLLSNGEINVSGKPVYCKDNTSCTLNAELLFSIYQDSLNLPDPTTLLPPLMSFDISSFTLDDLLQNYTTMLNSLNQDNLPTTMSYISNTSTQIPGLANNIATTIFRTPRLNDTADVNACNGVCFAICPSMNLDMAAAAAIHTESASLVQNLSPILNYQSESGSIAANTQSRLTNLQTKNNVTQYDNLFLPLVPQGSVAIYLGDEALVHVADQNLSTNLDLLKSLNQTIPQDIAADNFNSTSSDISEYGNLTNIVENGSLNNLNVYNQTLTAKNAQDSLIYVLQTKDLDPVSAKSLQLLENQTADIDAQFHDGLTVNQLTALQSSYANLTSQTQGLMNSESDTSTTRVLLLFRGFARQVNTGIAGTAQATSVVSPSVIPANPFYLISFSMLFFLSFSSIIVLVFLHIFSSIRFRIPKTAHIIGATFLILIVVVFIFSVFLYIFLGKTSTQATLPEFLTAINSTNATSIVVDLRNASLSESPVMISCANNLAQSFAAKNKAWSIYTLTSTSCVRTDSSGSNYTLNSTVCTKGIISSPSSFVLAYSQSVSPPKFSVIYQNQAQIKANMDYYQSCPLVAIFS